MGDVGSLPLGAALAMVALITKHELVLVIVGAVFVVEALSVITQVAYFQWTGGKRIFRMAPIHHHYELQGLARAADHRALLDHLDHLRADRAQHVEAAMTAIGITDEYRGRTVLVVGYGRTGIAVASHLRAAGARVRVADRRPAAELGPPPGDDGIELRCGRESVDDLDGVSLVVPSPGVPARARRCCASAVRRGIPVRARSSWRRARSAIPIVAVTGTNGKSTTTTLIGEMLRAGGERPFVGGNLGTPLVSAVHGRYVEWRSPRCRASSSSGSSACGRAIGVLLNVTEDHLDRYDGLDAYGADQAAPVRPPDGRRRGGPERQRPLDPAPCRWSARGDAVVRGRRSRGAAGRRRCHPHASRRTARSGIRSPTCTCRGRTIART